MKKKEQVRKRWLHIRINEEEYKKIEAFFKSTTCQGLSDYARRTLQQKPVVFKYRNTSLDEVLSEMIRLKNELSAIGNNFNQAVHKLHTLDHVHQIKGWVLQNETLILSFISKTEEIRQRMNQIYEVWSQK